MTIFSEFLEAILIEPQALVMTGDSMQRIGKQIQFELAAFEALDLLQFDLTPKEVIAKCNERRRGSDMTPCRMPLTVLLKGKIVMAFLQHTTGDLGAAVKSFRDAMGLFEEGLALWRDDDPQDRGTMSNNDILRASRALFATDSSSLGLLRRSRPISS